MDTESVSVVRDSLSSFSSEIHIRPFITVHSGNLQTCLSATQSRKPRANIKKQVVQLTKVVIYQQVLMVAVFFN